MTEKYARAAVAAIDCTANWKSASAESASLCAAALFERTRPQTSASQVAPRPRP